MPRGLVDGLLFGLISISASRGGRFGYSKGPDKANPYIQFVQMSSQLLPSTNFGLHVLHITAEKGPPGVPGVPGTDRTILKKGTGKGSRKRRIRTRTTVPTRAVRITYQDVSMSAGP